ncbi:MAG: DUF1269 domain-containing protein [Acidimicrobiales bacterium]|nr:DUF1269 domain-containing protein [Acidimicrobiales bacterium]
MENDPDTTAASDDVGAATQTEASTIVGLSFDDPFRAKEFQIAAMGMVTKNDLELLDVVTIVKEDNGRTHVVESIDPSPGQSALSGGMWAGLFGLLLGGPIGWAAGVVIGAGAGAVAAKVMDLGLPDDWVDWFREAVQPNTTTVVLLFGEIDVPAAIAELERFSGARLVYANVPPDVVGRIRQAIGDPATGPLTQQPQASVPPADGADASAEGSEAPPAT